MWSEASLLPSAFRCFWVAAALSSALLVQADQLNPYGLEPKWAAMGAKLYARFSCPMCHGPNARGGAGPDLTDETWIRQPTDTMLFNVIKHGRPGTMMAGYGDELVDEQIWMVVTYLRVQERQRAMEEGRPMPAH